MYLATDSNGKRLRKRRAAAAVELAILLPVLCLICMIAVDYSRLFYDWAIVAAAARNGALYASDSSFASSTTLGSIQAAALADASALSPTPTVTSATGTDSNGVAYVEVTVTYPFSTIVSYPGIPSSVSMSRKIRMAVTPP